MVLSAISFSIAYLFIKLSTTKIYLSLLIFLRFLIPLLIITAIFWIQKKRFATQNLKRHFLRAIFVVVAQYCIFFYITQNSLLNATVLLSTSPIFIPFIEWLFLNYRIARSTWISIGISAVGVFLILNPGTNLLSLMSLLGLTAGLCQAASQVILGMNMQKESSELNLFYLYFFGTILSIIPLFIFLGISPGHLSGGGIQIEVLLFLLILSLANMANQFFRGRAYAHKKPSTLSCFLYLSVLFSAFLDWSVFGKVPQVISIIGAFLVVLGGISKVYLRYLFLHKKQ